MLGDHAGRKLVSLNDLDVRREEKSLGCFQQRLAAVEQEHRLN